MLFWNGYATHLFLIQTYEMRCIVPVPVAPPDRAVDELVEVLVVAEDDVP